MRPMIRYTGILVLAAVAQFSIAEEAVQILTAGLHHGEDVTAESGPDWWGIFPEGDGFTLQSAPVTITQEFDVVVDEEGEATGKRVKVPQEAEPVLLVRGIKGLAAGSLNSVRLDSSQPFLYPGQFLWLRFTNEGRQSQAASIVAQGESTTIEYDTPVFTNYRLLLRVRKNQEVHVQEFVAVEPFWTGSAPRIVWAGDLDRDGMVDILLDVPEHESNTHYVLYLSGAAKEGELVGKVAEWMTTGC